MYSETISSNSNSYPMILNDTYTKGSRTQFNESTKLFQIVAMEYHFNGAALKYRWWSEYTLAHRKENNFSIEQFSYSTI